MHFILYGSLSTGHANGAKDMMSRLETMVLSGAHLPLPVIRQQITSALDIVIHLSRLRDGSRRVLEIAELLGVEQGEIVLSPLYVFQEQYEEDGKVIGMLSACHSLQKRWKLNMSGLERGSVNEAQATEAG